MTDHTHKRELSPSSHNNTNIKKSRIDTLFDTSPSEEEDIVAELSIGDRSFTSPIFGDRRSSLFEPGSGYDRTPTRDVKPQKSLFNDIEEEDEQDMLDSAGNPFRRSLYSELLNSHLEDEDEEDIESKTTLPLSKRQYDDEIDAFFSSHNPASEPAEFVLNATLKFNMLQEKHRQGPEWITEQAHFLTKAYFENYTIQDRVIPVPKVKQDISHFDSQFSVLSVLGQGEFSQVFKARCVETNKVYAIKKSKIKFTGWEDRWLKIVEVHHLNQMQHSAFCIHMINAWEQKGSLFIQLELCSKGSLEDFIMSKNRNIEQELVWKIFYEIAMGLKDIHEANIVHLDLKPSNILVNEVGCIKISDFGISVQTPVDIKYLKGEGDRRYMAPDLLRELFDKPADIFSLGLILLELATGIALPHQGESWEMLRVGDFSKQRPALSKVSKELKEMIEWMLVTEAKERPTIQDIIHHASFKQIKVTGNSLSELI